MSVEVGGVARIAEAFARARADGRRAALMPYMMGGFPDMATAQAIGEAYVEAGADLIELGVPFSDPLADGPVIHAADTVALGAGATTAGVLELGRALSGHGVPIVLMCYANPILARGLERFCDAAVGAGVSGLIVPDLPLEEAGPVREACDGTELALVPLVAPTTPVDRLERIGALASGFEYVVGVTGTTGERGGNGETGPGGEPAGPAALLARARAATEVPVALGFGIGTAEQVAAAAAAGADGVIVGTRLVRAAAESDDPAAAAGELVAGFAAALTTG